MSPGARTFLKRAALVALVGGAGMCVALPLGGVVVGRGLVMLKEHALASDEGLRTAGRAMALCSNATSTELSSSRLGIGWLPSELADLEPSFATIGPDGGHLGFGGGFHHASYDMRRDADGSFSIGFSSEDDWTPARSLVIGEGPRVSEAELLGRMRASYRRYVERSPDLHAHAGRLRFLLFLGDAPEARAAADDAVRAHEAHVGARYMKAVVDGVLGDEAGAATSFATWVTAHPGFRHATILVSYLASVGRTAEAKAWAVAALAAPLVETPGAVDAMWNFSALGVTLVAVVLPIDPDLAARLVDKVEKEDPDASSRAYFRPTLEALRRRALEQSGALTFAPDAGDAGSTVDASLAGIAGPLDFDREFFGHETFRAELRAIATRGAP